MSTQQTEALQCAADLEYSIARHGMQDAFTLNAYGAMKMVRTQHARIAELESQLAQSFDADDLRTAAQAVVDRWDTPLWKDVPATAEYIGRLRAALAAGQATAAPAQPAAQQGAAYAGMGHTDGGRNMFYEGRFDGESQREQQARLRWANDMRAAFERHTGNGWFDKDWRTETGLWSSAWYACLAAQPTTTALSADSVQEDAARYRWLCCKFGQTRLPCALENMLEHGYIADGKLPAFFFFPCEKWPGSMQQRAARR